MPKQLRRPLHTCGRASVTSIDPRIVDGLEVLTPVSSAKTCPHGNTIDRANGIDCLHCVWARAEPSNMERSNFEHWARAENYAVDRFDPRSRGGYVLPTTEAAWEAWQARAKFTR